MQNTCWQVNKKNAISADTFFSSEFYDFNNETSQMEDFDISKQYLKSQFSDRSMILRQYSQESFLKALQVYYRYSCAQSFCKLSVQERIMEKDQLNPEKKRQTKKHLNCYCRFLENILPLQQKIQIRSREVTAQNSKLYKNQRYEDLRNPNRQRSQEACLDCGNFELKILFGSPTNKQIMIKQSFREIRILSYAVINMAKIQNLALIVQKMANFNYLQKFTCKIEQLNMTKDKLDILVGTLSLVVNPLKRSFLYEFKQMGIKNKPSHFDYNQNQILDDEFLNCYEFLKQQKLEIYKLSKFKKSEYFAEGFTEDLVCEAFQKIEQQQDQFASVKSTISESIDIIFVQKPQIVKKNGEKNAQIDTPVKNPLKFSKQLQRKSSTCDKRNKLKFKSVPSSNTPKKIPQANYLDQHLRPHPILNDSLQNKTPHQQDNIVIASHLSGLSLKNIVQNLKAHQSCIKFEKSLNFTEKSQRKIALNQKTEKLCHKKPDQPSFGVPDYSNFYAHPCISIQTLRNQANNLLTQNQNQKKLTIFKTIKSGKPLNIYESFQSMKNLNETRGHSLKPSVKFTYNQVNQVESGSKVYPNLISSEKTRNIPLVFAQNGTLSPPRTLLNSRSDKAINFKCIQRLKSASSSSLQNFKNQYRFPINYATHANKKCQTTQRLDLNTKSIQFMKEYGNNTHRNNFQCKEKTEKQPYKSTSLAFKSKRPMKTVKSPNRQFPSGIKNTQLKKQKKSSDKDVYPKPKQNKQIKSDFTQSKYRVLSEYSRGQNLTVLSIQSGKSNNPNRLPRSPPHRNSGVKLVSRK